MPVTPNNSVLGLDFKVSRFSLGASLHLMHCYAQCNGSPMLLSPSHHPTAVIIDCRTGGDRHGGEGYFVQPTVFSDVKDHMRIAREEIFGPVQCIMKWKTTDEV